MKINKAIRQIMFDKGVSLNSMAKAIGKSRGNDISSRLLNDNMSCDKVVEMLDVLGYDLILVPRDPKQTLSRIIIDQK